GRGDHLRGHPARGARPRHQRATARLRTAAAGGARQNRLGADRRQTPLSRLRDARLSRRRRPRDVGEEEVVTDRSYRDEEIDAAIEALSDPGAFGEAERQVARAAPSLQRILAEALGAGGWFGESHESEVLKAATTPD